MQTLYLIWSITMKTANLIRESIIKNQQQDQDYHAVISWIADSAIQSCQDVVVVKDSINVKGFSTTNGTKSMGQQVETTSAEAVQKLEEAGYLITCKTNLHETMFGITSQNHAFGFVKNPLTETGIAGGSSGGTAVAIALGYADLGLGTDTGGSCRIPASLTGTYGFRPSTGRYPKDGVMVISPTRDTTGSFANSLDGILILDSLMAQSSQKLSIPDDKSIRLGVDKNTFWNDVDSGVKQTTESALSELERQGIQLIEVDAHAILALANSIALPIVLFEAHDATLNNLKQQGIALEDFLHQLKSPDVRAVFVDGIAHGLSIFGEQRISKEDYQLVMQVELPKLQKMYDQLFADHQLDALTFPTTPAPALPVDEQGMTVLNGVAQPAFPTYIRHMELSSLVASPSLCLPCGKTDEGLPVGISLDGSPNQDDHLLAVAQAINSVLQA